MKKQTSLIEEAKVAVKILSVISIAGIGVIAAFYRWKGIPAIIKTVQSEGNVETRYGFFKINEIRRANRTEGTAVFIALGNPAKHY